MIHRPIARRSGKRINKGSLSGSKLSAPTAAMGAKAWWTFRDPSAVFSDDGVTPITNGGGIYRCNDQLSVVASDHFRQATAAARPVWTIGGAGNQAYASFDGTNHFIDSLAISNFFANNAKVLIMALSIEAGSLANDQVFSDQASHYLAGVVQASNGFKTSHWPGVAYKLTTGITYTPGTPFVYVFKHADGNLYDAKNGIEWTTGVADGGVTTTLINTFTLATDGAAKPVLKMYDVVAGNTISDTNILSIVNYLKSKLVIS